MILKISELTVNWHILEACNYDCYFCYAKYNKKSNFSRDFNQVLHDLSTLKGKKIDFASGSVFAESIRINYAGGEPFLEKNLTTAISVAHELGLNPSFITNGSLLTDDFIREYGKMISVAGFSIDSFDVNLNQKIGRRDNKGYQVTFERLSRIFSLFRECSPQTSLKINTVVCLENVDIDLTTPLNELRPDRWKVLRVIPIHGAERQGISDEQFKDFLIRHQYAVGRVVPEDNVDMHRSYLMLNPEGRFYQRVHSGYLKSKPVVQVGAMTALKEVEFDAPTYLSRY